MSDKGVLIVGGILAAGVVLVLVAKQNSQTQLAQQQLQYASQVAQSPSGQVGSILSSVGGFLGSGSLSGINGLFGFSSGGSNNPGLGYSSADYVNSDSNDPGLETDSSDVYSDDSYDA